MELCAIKNDKRNYGIDLLRILSMFFIVLLHSFGHGGIISALNYSNLDYKIIYFFEIFAFCAVNIFGLISGYVAFDSNNNKKIKFSNLLNIWFEVVFYCLLIYLVFNTINPSLVSKSDFIKSIFPVSNSIYWYITAYFGLFIISPLLVNSMNGFSIIESKKFLIILFVAFSIIGTIFNIFNLSNGYSVLWLIILYIIGMILKKCEIGKSIKPVYLFVSIFILCAITWLYNFYGFEINALGLNIKRNILVSYTSPTILLIAIFYVIAFSKIKFNDMLKKIIKFLAPSALSIYLVNDHPLIRENIIKDMFAKYCSNGVLTILLYVFAFAFIFVTFMLLFDKLRDLIFKKLRINKISNKIVDTISKVLDTILDTNKSPKL